MDVLSSGRERDEPAGRAALRRLRATPGALVRAGGRAPLALLVVLLLLAAGQVAVLRASRRLPPDVQVAVAEGGYVVGPLDEPSLVTFQLRSTGRAVQVRGLSLGAPGLRLVDAAAAGESVGFRRVGDGPAPLPAFRLEQGVTLVLTFAATDCRAIDDGRYPVMLDLAVGYRRAVLALPLRDYPDLTGQGGPDVPWQRVLAAALCP